MSEKSAFGANHLCFYSSLKLIPSFSFLFYRLYSTVSVCKVSIFSSALLLMHICSWRVMTGNQFRGDADCARFSHQPCRGFFGEVTLTISLQKKRSRQGQKKSYFDIKRLHLMVYVSWKSSSNESFCNALWWKIKSQQVWIENSGQRIPFNFCRGGCQKNSNLFAMLRILKKGQVFVG